MFYDRENMCAFQAAGVISNFLGEGLNLLSSNLVNRVQVG